VGRKNKVNVDVEETSRGSEKSVTKKTLVSEPSLEKKDNGIHIGVQPLDVDIANLPAQGGRKGHTKKT